MDDNYTKSNSIELIPKLKISQITKQFYYQFREQTIISVKDLQHLTNNICMDLGINDIAVTFTGTQPHKHNGKRLQRKTLGIHRQHKGINIYRFTAVRKKQISPKTAIDTLLHEIMHRIDYVIIELTKSIHSKGFYSRLKHLTETIKE